MFKHLRHKHFKKKHHHKMSGHMNQEEKPKETIPFFVTFSLSTFGILFYLIPTLLIIWAFISFEVKYNDRFYPSVFVGGESVGGQTYMEALSHFKERARQLQKDGLNVNLENSKVIKKINIPMSTTGLTSDNSVEYFTLDDWENDLQKAYKWGHGVNIFRDLKEQLSLLFIKENFNFSTSLQKEAVDSLIENELNSFLKKSVPATFLSDGNKISISKESAGEIINKEEVVNNLESKLAQFDTTPETFKSQTDIPKIAEIDLSPFLDFVENFTNKTNLVFQYQGHTWKIMGPKLITWLTVKKDIGIDIDHSKLENYLANTVAKFINNPPQNSRFEIKNGKLVEIIPGKSGNIIDIDNVTQKIEKIILDSKENLNIKNGTIYLPIETIEVEPKVTKETIEKYNIKNLVGEISTSFEGSTADREHNIKIGVAAITGMLIAPGAEFSTVSSIGHVTGKEGYVKELVIKENKTTKEYGGGLCQVATTLFRLALNAGLPISERTNHRFTVHYYDPPGLDATIYAPHPDFRFINDTGGYLLLQAKVKNKKVIMEVYGQKDGRSSQISKAILSNPIPAPSTKYVKTADLPVGEKKCSETPHDGITTDVLYTINYPDGTVKEKNFHSIYQPWQKVCLIGTALTQ